MSAAVELKKLVKQLQSASTDEEVVNLLNILKKDFQVNEAVLRESKAGLAVGKLRSHTKKEVSELAKELVKKWKNEVELSKAGTKTPARKASLATTPAIPVTTNGNNSKAKSRTAKGDGIQMDVIGDYTRDKCMELIYGALASDSGAPTDLILTRAKGIEKAVWVQHDGTTPAYKTKIRTLYVNLKDKNNPSLRENVVSGDLSVDRFTDMTSEEMASEERRAADDKIKQENLHNSLGAEQQQAETDAFQCGRCKQRKCRYRQAQTRSADEPMTTFVTCVNCGNRWKFS
jgi:transcription elongation factor S-II